MGEFSVAEYIPEWGRKWITWALGISTLFTTLLILLPSSYDANADTLLEDAAPDRSTSLRTASGGKKKRKRIPVKTSVQIVVLGDIGRSPRMQYHALSFAKHGARVDIIGYKESDLHPDVEDNSLINIIPIGTPPSLLRTENKFLFLFFGPLKVLWQVWSLWYSLGYRSRPAKWMLVQNPPSIPTLAVAWWVCFLRSTHFIIDWHNLGYSLLALKYGNSHPFVLLSSLYERICSGLAVAHITVTSAMTKQIHQSYSVKSVTCHDRPAPIFQPLTKKQRSTFLSQLPETKPHSKDINYGKSKLLVTSTSYTPDEDLQLFLNALSAYSSTADLRPTLPNLVVVITGKGPLKQHYLNQIAALESQSKLEKVKVLTAFLPMSDYARLLASADLGISLHKSSSGVDLPMKVVDMFGCGLPVAGYSKFAAWPELVREGENGRGFETQDELIDILVELLDDKDGSGKEQLDKLRKGAELEGKTRWDAIWDKRVGVMCSVV